jgi:hypothetical protein
MFMSQNQTTEQNDHIKAATKYFKKVAKFICLRMMVTNGN